MKLKALKMANAVKVGQNEHLFLNNEKHDIDLLGEIRVRIVEKRTQAKSYTTLYNVIYWMPENDEPELDTSTAGGGKKKATT